MKTRYTIYCVLIALAAFSAEASADMLDDVNADGMITTADSLLALRMAAGSVAPDPECADVNADGRVGSLDALMIWTIAAQQTHVCVNAPEVVSGAFDVTIDIHNVADLDSGQFDLSFDPDVVTVTDVSVGNIGGTTVPVDCWSFADADTIVTIFNLPMVYGVSGSGYVARIDFAITGSEGDACVLDISNGLLVDRNADKIPGIWIDCEVAIGEYTPPANRIHNLATGEDFLFIQDAIDDPDTLDGHVIKVGDGLYRENVQVTKSLTIRSENGSANCVIEAARRCESAALITADCVNISGFTVKGTTFLKAGICLDAGYCNVSNNNCSNNDIGICLDGSGNNHVSNNDCSNNMGAGIHLESSGNNNNNNVSSNNCSNNWEGIRIDGSSNNSISNNNCSNTWHGIRLYESCNNNVSNNDCPNNRVDSIYLDGSSNNSISNNDCTDSLYGIRLGDSCNNSISSNNCSNNEGAGVRLYGSCNNIVYLNNFINNAGNIDSRSSTNIWNSTLEINYTYRGKTFANYLGNYRDDYAGNDSDNDGIGDSPYDINSDEDNYPLVMPIENYFVGTANASEQKEA